MVTSRLAVAALVFATLACAGPGVGARPEPARKFIVMLEGRNLLLDYRGKLERFGFATTRNVVAPDVEAAERIAIEEVRNDERLVRTLENPPEDPPRYTVTHHIEVRAFDAVRSPDLGYIFYRDRDTN